jgi:hypothetical protein
VTVLRFCVGCRVKPAMTPMSDRGQMKSAREIHLRAQQQPLGQFSYKTPLRLSSAICAVFKMPYGRTFI